MSKGALSPVGIKMGRLATALIDAGTAWFDGSELLARASDTVTVTLGDVWTKGDAARIEAYLTAHPTPDTW